VVPPYPHCIEEDQLDVPMEDCWYASPQLFFMCVLRLKNGRVPKNRTYTTGPYDIIYILVFFSTFEELKLPIKGPMEDTGVIKLYEPSPAPCLYVADLQNMMGRVPLIPLFLAGNSTPTIPHMFSKRKDSGFPYGCADTAATDGRRGSNVYEVNPWLWQFGRGKLRLGGCHRFRSYSYIVRCMSVRPLSSALPLPAQARAAPASAVASLAVLSAEQDECQQPGKGCFRSPHGFYTRPAGGRRGARRTRARPGAWRTPRAAL
jgi:hypothetical protein